MGWSVKSYRRRPRPRARRASATSQARRRGRPNSPSPLGEVSDEDAAMGLEEAVIGYLGEDGQFATNSGVQHLAAGALIDLTRQAIGPLGGLQVG